MKQTPQYEITTRFHLCLVLSFTYTKMRLCILLNQIINVKELCEKDPQVTMLDCAYKTCNHIKILGFLNQ
jgi:hypothetical protein